MPSSLGPTSPHAHAEKLRGAARALETIVLKSLVTSSKAFTGGEGAGSAVRADLFADALAEAMVKGGGIGLARQIERSVAPRSGPATTAGLPAAPPAAPRGAGPSAAAHAPGPRTAPAPAPPSPPPGATALPRVTSPYGPRADPFDGHLTRHDGVDWAAHEGASVYAVAGGVVRAAGERGGYGQAVEIDHGAGVTTLYAHASELLVRPGDRVAPGQPVARVGHTGRSTGSHLHFEVRRGGRAVDPGRALKSYAPRDDEPPSSGT